MLVSVVSLHVPNDWVGTYEAHPENHFPSSKEEEIAIGIVVLGVSGVQRRLKESLGAWGCDGVEENVGDYRDLSIEILTEFSEEGIHEVGPIYAHQWYHSNHL